MKISELKMALDEWNICERHNLNDKRAARILAKAYLDGSRSAEQHNDSSMRPQTGGFLKP